MYTELVEVPRLETLYSCEMACRLEDNSLSTWPHTCSWNLLRMQRENWAVFVSRIFKILNSSNFCSYKWMQNFRDKFIDSVLNILIYLLRWTLFQHNLTSKHRFWSFLLFYIWKYYNQYLWLVHLCDMSPFLESWNQFRSIWSDIVSFPSSSWILQVASAFLRLSFKSYLKIVRAYWLLLSMKKVLLNNKYC